MLVMTRMVEMLRVGIAVGYFVVSLYVFGVALVFHF